VRFPRGALEASEAHESHRERLCHRAAPAAGDEGRGLEDARARLRLQTAGHGEPALAQARRRPAPPPGASRGEVHGWHHAGAARSRRAEGRRLINPRSTTFDNSSTDGAGLVLLRRLWDRLGLGPLLEEKVRGVRGVYRPSLLVEVWVALLFYGGKWLDDLALLRSRG